MKQTFLAPNYSPNSLSLRHLKKCNFPEKGVGVTDEGGCSTSFKQMQTEELFENFERIVLRHEIL